MEVRIPQKIKTNGYTITVKKLFDMRYDAGFSAPFYKYFVSIFFPSKNLLVFTTGVSMFLYDTKRYKKIREISPPKKEYIELTALNSDIFITTEKDDRKIINNSIRSYSLSNLYFGKMNYLRTYGTDFSKFDREIVRIDDETFTCIYPFFISQEENELRNCIEVYDFYKSHQVNKISLGELGIILNPESVLRLSQEFTKCLYFTCNDHKKAENENYGKDEVYNCERVGMVNLSTKEFKYWDPKIRNINIQSLEVFNNNNNNSELLVAGGYSTENEMRFYVINFSKSKAVLVNTVYLDSSALPIVQYHNPRRSKSTESFFSLEDQILFVGCEYGLLFAYDIRENMKLLFKVEVVPTSEIVEVLMFMNVLSYSKKSIDLMIVGFSFIHVVKIRGININVKKNKKELWNGIWLEDRKERINFLRNSKEKYFFKENEILGKKCLLDIQLFNLRIKNAMKFFF